MPQLPLFMNQDVVVKSNDLVRGQTNWTTMEHRVIAMMIAQLRKEADVFAPQRVYIKDLLDMSGVGGRALYGRAEKLCSKLLDQKIQVRTVIDGKRAYVGYNPISMCQYIEGDGYIVAKFNDDMRPFLLQLKGRFTMYRLQNFLKLSSQHAMRVYELLMMRSDLHHFRISVDELRTILSCEDSYPRFSDFKRRTLDRAQTEIHDKTSITFRYKVERKGRTPTHVYFRILSRDEKERQRLRDAHNASSESPEDKAPPITAKRLLLDDLSQEELDRFSMDTIEAALADAERTATERDGNRSEMNQAVTAYRIALHQLRQKTNDS